jgi:hypothetical protein
VEQPPDGDEGGGEVVVLPDHERHPRRPRLGDHRVGVLERARDRLLEEHGLPVRGGEVDVLPVQRVRRAEEQGVDPGIGGGRLVGAEGRHPAEPPAVRLGASRIPAGEADGHGAAQAPGSPGVKAGEAPAAHDAEAEWGHQAAS